jgi:hypothetical protein
MPLEVNWFIIPEYYSVIINITEYRRLPQIFKDLNRGWLIWRNVAALLNYSIRR